jgi:hypothetical protein
VSATLINLFGGPGTGKSTTMAAVFSFLKNAGALAEMAPEFAKDVVWERNFDVLRNQIAIFGEQHRRVFRLVNQVEFIVTDSPLLNSVLYGRKAHMGPTFLQLVIEEHRKLPALNVFLRRTKRYEERGRVQDYASALALDAETLQMLHAHAPGFLEVDADSTAAPKIVAAAMRVHEGD